MTKSRIIPILAISLWQLFGSAGAVAQTVINSPHDLSTGSSVPTPSTSGTDETCVFCHTPHFTADPNTTPVALWNRSDPVTADFAMYTSATLDMSVAANPQGVSLACLSCHDGATAFDAILNPPGTFSPGTAVMTNASATVGADGLSNDHPVSVTYDVGADPGLVTPANGRVAGLLPLFRAPGVTSGDGTQLECASCHDPHNWTANGNFLRVSNSQSGLCRTCHLK